MTDVVLINPPLTRAGGPLKEHLGLGYLTAAVRRAGLTVRIIDAPASRLDFPALKNELLAEEFQVLGISVVFQDSLRPVLDWLAELRADGLDAHVTIGAHPATFAYENILTEYDCADSVVRGEGEITLVELARAVLGGVEWRGVAGLAWRDGDEVVVNQSRPLVSNLDSLAWPARDIVTAHPGIFEQVAAISTRGCHEQCSFCSIATFYRSFKGHVWRRRDPDDVLDEIDAVQTITPSPFVLLYDDSFIGPGKIGRQQAFEFADALGRREVDYMLGVSCRADQVEEDLFRDLKRAGLRSVFLGIESGNDETLALFNKETTVETNRRALHILEKLGYAVEIGFIMFNPYTTFEQVRRDLDFLRDTGMGPDPRNLSDMGFFPGQPLLERVKNDGLLDGDEFGFTSRFADGRVGDMVASIKSDLLPNRPAPELMRAAQTLQADKLGVDDVPSAVLALSRAAVEGIHRAVYDVIKTSTSLFEEGRADVRALAALRRELDDRLADLAHSLNDSGDIKARSAG